VQGEHHVAQTAVRLEAAVAERGQVEEPEGAEPVVDRHDHHVAVGGKRPAVIERLVGRPQDVRAAVHPHHHRLAVSRSGVGRGPHVEAQAVLGLRRTEVDGDAGVGGLRTHRPHPGGVGDL
jgi:hypothetical protein